MTTPKTLRDEDGREFRELVPVIKDTSLTLDNGSVLYVKAGDLIVRPIPQPGPTVEEARKALADTVHDAVGACNGWRMSTEWVEDHKRTLDTSLDALIAAVRREAQQAQPKGGA